jgi:hypothetical protein
MFLNAFISTRCTLRRWSRQRAAVASTEFLRQTVTNALERGAVGDGAAEQGLRRPELAPT